MPILLILMLVLGAVGLFLALPGGRADLSRLGLLVLAIGAALLVAGLTQQLAGEPGQALFAGCSLVALLAALRVVTHRKPVYSALYFVLLVVAVSILLVRMQAEFVFGALLIVYAGAILVTYLFVIMLAQQARPAPYDTRSREPLWGCLAGFVLLTQVAAYVYRRPASEQAAVLPRVGGDAILNVATPLLTHYVVGLEIVGVLLLAALVGAIAIARRPAATADEGED
jgi:NADH-quinone oxidoreductase subunit J